MIVNGKEYKYRIEPRWGKVQAEVYYISDVLKNDFEISLISKGFKKSLFGSISDQDYVDAKDWAEKHISNILKANKDQL